MGFSEINNMMKEAVDNIKSMIDSGSVVGEAVASENATVIPISKLSVGFVTGGFEFTKKKEDAGDMRDKQPLAAMGGGVSMTPMGFLVITNEGDASFIKTEGDSTDKWLEIVESTIKNVIKK